MKWIDSETAYDDITLEEKLLLQLWIALHVVEDNQTLDATSLGISTTLCNSTGMVFTNGQFKGAMLAAGHYPTQNLSEQAEDWTFKINRTCLLQHIGEDVPIIHFCLKGQSYIYRKLMNIASNIAKQAKAGDLDRARRDWNKIEKDRAKEMRSLHKVHTVRKVRSDKGKKRGLKRAERVKT